MPTQFIVSKYIYSTAQETISQFQNKTLSASGFKEILRSDEYICCEALKLQNSRIVQQQHKYLNKGIQMWRGKNISTTIIRD